MGAFQRSGNAVFHPTPVTGSAAMSDPLANLQAPSTGSSQGAVSVAGNSSRSIQPGTYTQIAVSGNASLTLTPGIYVVSSGGFTASGNATIKGSGVVIYVAAGSINLSGNSTVLLTPPTSGAYYGVGIFQARSDASTIYLAGNTYLASGTLYAPKAALNMSGNSNISAPLIVDQLALSGNADPSPTPPSRPSTGRQVVAGRSGGHWRPGVTRRQVASPIRRQNAVKRTTANVALASLDQLMASHPPEIRQTSVRY